MLTKKQLQALVDCGEKEDCTGETCPMFEICDNDYTNKVAAEAAKTALAYRKTLERLETVLKQARVALEEIEKCCEINVDDGYHTCQRKCREAAARARFVREVIDELEGSE